MEPRNIDLAQLLDLYQYGFKHIDRRSDINGNAVIVFVFDQELFQQHEDKIQIPDAYNGVNVEVQLAPRLPVERHGPFFMFLN